VVRDSSEYARCDLNHNPAVWQGYGLFASNCDEVDIPDVQGLNAALDHSRLTPGCASRRSISAAPLRTRHLHPGGSELSPLDSAGLRDLRISPVAEIPDASQKWRGESNGVPMPIGSIQ